MNEMSKMVRLSKDEEKALNNKCIEINKVLIGRNLQPVKDSELIHKILIKALDNTIVNTLGEVTLDI